MSLRTKKVCGFSDPHNTSLLLRMLLLFIAICSFYCCSTIRKVMGGAGHKMKDFYSRHCRKHQCIAQSFYALLAHLLCSTAPPTVVKKITRGSKNLWNNKETKQMVVCFTSAHFHWNASPQSPKELVPCVHYHVLPPNQLTTPTHFQPTIMKIHAHSILIAMHHTAHIHVFQ